MHFGMVWSEREPKETKVEVYVEKIQKQNKEVI